MDAGTGGDGPSVGLLLAISDLNKSRWLGLWLKYYESDLS